MAIILLKNRLEKIKTRLEKKITEITKKKFSLKTFSLSWENILTLVLILISLIYGVIVRIRALLYRKKILKTKKLPCIVISIGNITIGGSGKTPMAIYLAQAIKKAGLKPVVLSRGYKSRMENGVAIAGNGSIVLSTSEDVGDEPYMMAKRGSFPVVVGKNRFKAGMMAIKLFNPDIIILDDGFQHIQLHRDINMVLLDYKKPFGNGRLLPAGRLRELSDEIEKRADLVIFTRCKDDGHEADLNLSPHRPSTIYSKPALGLGISHIFYTRHKPFLFLFNGQNSDQDSASNEHNLDKLRGKNAFLFSGIADNNAFRRTMENLNIHVKDHLEFMDHYRYNEQDISAIIKRGKTAGADLIITTEKDYARLCDDIDWEMDMAVIGIDIDWTVNGKQYEKDFLCFIKEKIVQVSSSSAS